MKALTRLIVCFALVAVVITSLAAAPKPFAFPRSTPESQGVSSAAVLALVEALDQLDTMNSFMLVRHGKVIAEGWWAPYRAEDNHELYSLSKSFTSTAVGMAVAEGKLSIDDEVLKFFPEDAPSAPTNNLRAMRVRDLLTMATGHQDEPPTGMDKVSTKTFLAHPVPHKPGTHFKYNTAATLMLSAIVQKQTGQTVLDYLKPRLFEPLGITQPTWGTNSQGISLGGYGLSVRTEDIARFGQLYLQKGKWQGQQLLAPEWVEMATSRQVSNGSNPKSDWEQGYGFQFWRCRNGAYRGDGAFGQYCIVLPEQDAVIAITSGVRDMQGVLNLVWEKLLPGLRDRRMMSTAQGKELKSKLNTLTLRAAEGAGTSPLTAKILGRKFLFPTNDQKLESLTIKADENTQGLNITIQSGGATHSFPAGFGEWKSGPGTFGLYANAPAAATSAWAANDTLVVKQCFTETPFYVVRKMRFDGDKLFYDAESNVGFRGTKQPQLIGQAE
jgi:CubicO group peptidase (beta-lactamase class C family)